MISLQKPLQKAGSFLTTCLILNSCSPNAVNLFHTKSERAVYTERLTSSGIEKTKTGKVWLAAGSEVLTNHAEINVPAQIKGSFKSKSIQALAWKIEVLKGTSVEFTVQWNPQDSSALFIDLLDAEDLNNVVAFFSPLDSPYKFEAKENTSIIIRLQPEIFGEGGFTLSVKGAATYTVFPVEGKNNSAIMSFWGMARDGGARKHEGIDIFAARETPVLAPTQGYITSVREGGLGGKQVWMRDIERGYNLYFAHLDSQAVGVGKKVDAGDTLGFVGNTGNARFTKPHLHFGIYERGAFDPLPLVNTNHPAPQAVNLSPAQKYMVVTAQKANMRSGPGSNYPVIFALSENNPVRIEAALHDWYQIMTPDGKRGFIFHNLLKDPNPIDPVETETLISVSTHTSLNDTLSIEIKDFKQIGTYQNVQVLLDSDGNMFYR